MDGRDASRAAAARLPHPELQAALRHVRFNGGLKNRGRQASVRQTFVNRPLTVR
jgi:hypothetical protein